MKLLVVILLAFVAAESLAQDVGRQFPLLIDGNFMFGSGGTEAPTTGSPREPTTTPMPTTSQRQQRPTLPKRPACSADSQCGRVGKVYCNKFYGTCNVCIREQQPCRRTKTCCKGMECRFGTCQLPRKPGRVGSRCKADRDCPKETCCARHYGHDVCKPKLRVGEECDPGTGGVWWSFHNHCPCGTNLRCAVVQEPYRIRIGFYVLTFPFMRAVSRCQRYLPAPSSPTTMIRVTADLGFLRG